VAVECPEVEEKTSSSTAVQDTSKSDHDDVLQVHIHTRSSGQFSNLILMVLNILKK